MSRLRRTGLAHDLSYDDDKSAPRASGVLPIDRSFEEEDAELLRAETLRSEAPTLPPPRQAVSVAHVGVETPIHELLYRFAVGDYAGALATAHALFDEERIPIPMGAHDLIPHFRLSYREAFLLSFIDGSTPLEEVLAASGLPMLDALRTFCELWEKKVVSLH